MPTKVKENYLKALYHLDQQNHHINVTDLSKEMGVSKPTANNMVKRLQSDGWIVYRKYKPLELTDKGRKVAALIIRKHRLAEMFLTQVMGFGWEEVHEMAEELEHIQSDKFFSRMDQMLDHPEVDPHGSPIPDTTGHVVKNDYVSLAKLNAGSQARLCALKNSSEDLLLLLNKYEVVLGSLIEVMEIEPFDKSFLIRCDKKNTFSVSHKVCEQLLVDVIKK